MLGCVGYGGVVGEGGWDGGCWEGRGCGVLGEYRACRAVVCPADVTRKGLDFEFAGVSDEGGEDVG